MHASLLLSAALVLASLATPSAAVQAPRRHNPHRMLCLVNKVRADHHLPALGYNSALGRTALDHSHDQARMRKMTHDSSTGLSLGTRCAKQGYKDWRTVGENVAYGYTGDESCLKAWLESPGHRDNILNPKFTHFGYGVAYDGDTPYYTQDFGGDGGKHSFPVCADEGGYEGDAEHHGGARGPRGHPGRRPPVYEGGEHVDVVHESGPTYGDAHRGDDYAEAPHPVGDGYAGDVAGYSDDDEHCDADYSDMDGSHHGRKPIYEGGEDVISEHHDRPAYPEGGSHHGRPAYGGSDVIGEHHDQPAYPEGDGSYRGRRPSYPGGHPGGEYPEGDGSYRGRRPSYPGGHPGGEYPEGDGSYRGRRPSYPGSHPGGEYPEGDGSYRGRRPSYPGAGGSHHGRPAYGGGKDVIGDHHDRPAYPEGDGSYRGRRPSYPEHDGEHIDIIKPAYGRPGHGGDHVDVIPPPPRPAYGRPGHDGEHVDIIKPAYGRPGHGGDHVDVIPPPPRPAYGRPANHDGDRYDGPPRLPMPGRPVMPRGRHAPGQPIFEGEHETEVIEEVGAAPVQAAAQHAEPAADDVDPSVMEAAGLQVAQPEAPAQPEPVVRAQAAPAQAAPAQGAATPTGDEPALDVAPTDMEEH